MNIPQGLDALTPEWLTTMLRERGVITKATVTSIRVEPLGDDKGITSQLARLHLTYQGDEEDIPATRHCQVIDE